jgi:organic hydroperoxide reductase OsmC/OhrA
MSDEHRYEARITWQGNRGDGTATYQGYGREYEVAIAGKPSLQGSADPAFRGDAAVWNPEDMFLASLSACHMLSYLALCAKYGIRVLTYEDRATGTMRTTRDGGGRFEEVVLHPRVTIADVAKLERARELHETAHDKCFIASSCSVPIRHVADVTAQ